MSPGQDRLRGRPRARQDWARGRDNQRAGQGEVAARLRGAGGLWGEGRGLQTMTGKSPCGGGAGRGGEERGCGRPVPGQDFPGGGRKGWCDTEPSRKGRDCACAAAGGAGQGRRGAERGERGQWREGRGRLRACAVRGGGAEGQGWAGPRERRVPGNAKLSSSYSFRNRPASVVKDVQVM